MEVVFKASTDCPAGFMVSSLQDVKDKETNRTTKNNSNVFI